MNSLPIRPVTGDCQSDAQRRNEVGNGESASGRPLDIVGGLAGVLIIVACPCSSADTEYQLFVLVRVRAGLAQVPEDGQATVFVDGQESSRNKNSTVFVRIGKKKK